MGQNRVWYKTQAREQGNAIGADWTDALVSMWFRNVFDQGWSRILNADAAYRVTKLEMTADADGIISIADVNTSLSPAVLYRVFSQQTVRNKRLAGVYETVLEPWITGDDIRFGGNAANSSVTFWCNSRPQNPEDYTTTPNTTLVDWPSGHEPVLVNHLAAMLLTKGAVQAADSAQILAVADQLYTDMIQDLMDRTTRHQQIVPSDNADEWSRGLVY